MTIPKFYIPLFDEVVPDIQPFVRNPCIRFRNWNFEIVPCQLRFGRLDVPKATRNVMAESRVKMHQDGSKDEIKADGTLGIRITKKEALDDRTSSKTEELNEIIMSLEMIRAQPSLIDESQQSFITGKNMLRVRKADPEMAGGNRRMLEGIKPSPSHEGFFT